MSKIKNVQNDLVIPNILFLINTMKISGAETYAFSLVNSLNRNKRKIIIACNPKSPLMSEMIKLGNKNTIALNIGPKLTRKTILDFILFSTIYFFKILWMIITVQKKNKVNVLLFQFKKEQILGTIVAKILNIPVIWIEQGRLPISNVFGFNFPKAINKQNIDSYWKQFILKNLIVQFIDTLIVNLYSKVSNWTSSIIVVSNDVKKSLMDVGVKEEKIYVVYNGVDLSKFSLQKIITSIRVLNIPIEHVVIGNVSAIGKEKGHIFLLKAFCKVKTKIPESKLVIVGDGNYRMELEKIAHDLNIIEDVIFTGFRRDVPQLINIFDVLVHPTYAEYEGCPIVLVEAMAMRVPVVATNWDGIPEVVLDGETGLLVPIKDYEGLANAILKILQNKRLATQMGLKGRIRVKELFDLEKMSNKTYDIIKLALNPRLSFKSQL